MMNCRIFMTSTAVVATTFLSACSGTYGADQILAMPEDVQRQAIMSCQADQGLNIPEAVNVLRLNNGSVAVSVVNGPGLPLAQARAINQCAQAKLLSGQSYTPAPAATQPATQRPAPVATFEPVYQTSVANDAPAGCVRGQGTMQGGSLVCPGY